MNKATGKEVTSIAYEVASAKANENYELFLGQISATPKKVLSPTAVNDVTFDDLSFDEEAMFAGIRLS